MTCHLSDRDHEDLNKAYADLADAIARIAAVQARHRSDLNGPIITAIGRANLEIDMAVRDVHLAEHYLEPDAVRPDTCAVPGCLKPAAHEYDAGGDGPNGWLCEDHDAIVMRDGYESYLDAA